MKLQITSNSWRTLVAAFTLASALPATAAPTSYKVFTGSPAGFNATSTLIEGDKDAVLIDAQFTLADAHRLVAMVLESKKNLTTVYVTHAHPDHYWGLVVIKQAFPKAKLVALPDTVKDIKASVAKKIKQWKPMYGSNVPDKPLLPEALAGNTLTLEGEAIELTGGVQGDTENNSIVWVPSLKLAITGDIVYNDAHVWMLDAPLAKSRADWIKTLDRLAAMKPALVVAGHKSADAADTPQAIDFTREYVKAFDAQLANGATVAQIKTAMNAKYPNLKTLAVALDLAANGLGKK
jgi:glyoxylase-like metal-dependent hydrolase (beta-lactamase superfamily II)